MCAAVRVNADCAHISVCVFLRVRMRVCVSLLLHPVISGCYSLAMITVDSAAIRAMWKSFSASVSFHCGSVLFLTGLSCLRLRDSLSDPRQNKSLRPCVYRVGIEPCGNPSLKMKWGFAHFC